MITRKESRKGRPKRFALLVCGTSSAVVSIGRGEHARNTGYTYEALTDRIATSVCKRALKSGRKALREEQAAVDAHPPGEYGLAGLFDDFTEASLASSLMSAVLSAQLVTIQSEEMPASFSDWMEPPEPDKALIDHRESETRKRLLFYIENVLGDGLYTGVRNLTTLPGPDILDRIFRACQQAPFPIPEDGRDFMVEPELANVIIWLLTSITKVLSLHSYDYSKAQTDLYTSFAYFRVALGVPLTFPADGHDRLWASLHPMVPGIGLPEVIVALEKALDAMRFWEELRAKGTPVSWAVRFVRNRTGLALSDDEAACIEDLMADHPIRDSIDEVYALMHSSGKRSLPHLSSTGFVFASSYVGSGKKYALFADLVRRLT